MKKMNKSGAKKTKAASYAGCDRGRGRPKAKPTIVVVVPVDRIAAVEKVLKRPVAPNQVPTVRVRIAKSDEAKVRKAIG